MKASLETEKDRTDIRFHYDGYTNACFYDASVWEMEESHSFKRMAPLSKKKNTVYRFCHRRDKSVEVNILHCHLKASSPLLVQNVRDMYQYFELYDIFKNIRNTCNHCLKQMISVGDHNNVNCEEIYELVLSTIEL